MLNCKYMLTVILLMAFVNCDAEIIWKHGVAVVDGKPLYIDSNKLDQRTMVVSKNWINKYKKTNKKIINFGKLLWDENKIYIYDTEVNNPYSDIIETEKEYQYKIQKDGMYITKDGKEWDKLEIKIIDENPPTPKGKYVNPVYMIIYLKCKWFNGEYELFGATG